MSPVRILASALVAIAIGGAIPTLTTAPAQAKRCKWVAVSYDPVTRTTVWECRINRP